MECFHSFLAHCVKAEASAVELLLLGSQGAGKDAVALAVDSKIGHQMQVIRRVSWRARIRRKPSGLKLRIIRLEIDWKSALWLKWKKCHPIYSGKRNGYGCPCARRCKSSGRGNDGVHGRDSIGNCVNDAASWSYVARYDGRVEFYTGKYNNSQHYVRKTGLIKRCAQQ